MTSSPCRLLASGAVAVLCLVGARHADAVYSASVFHPAAVSPAARGLQGQAVHLDFMTPDKSTLFENAGTQTVTPAGVTFVSLKEVYTKVTANRITLTYNGGGRFHPTVFSGIRLTEVGSKPATIVSVTVDPASPPQSYSPSPRLSFDSHHVYYNLQNLNSQSLDSLILDVKTK